jgi:RNA 3'-terminal phosphate cyclase-like protein
VNDGKPIENFKTLLLAGSHASIIMPASSSLAYKSAIDSRSKGGAATTTLKFDDGAIQFRQRICVALLTHRRLLMRNIRCHNTDDALIIGLQAHEASFLKLIDTMTNGSVIEINATGTQLLFQPGILLGGEITHACPVGTLSEKDIKARTNGNIDTDVVLQGLTARSIGWYIEGIIPLAPFGKEPLRLTLTGITDGGESDLSCDYLRLAALPILARFGVGPSLSTSRLQPDTNDLLDDHGRPTLRVTRRGAYPKGGGAVEFSCPVVRATLQHNLQDFTDPGKVKRIRGTAITCQLVSSSAAARVAYAAKGVAQRLLPDVWIHTDAHTTRNHQCGPSPSVRLVLAAETTTGVVYGAEVALASPERRELPEDLGVRGAVALLEEIRRGGCLDTDLQPLVLMLMSLCPEEDLCRVRTGPLSPASIATLRLLQQAMGVTFKVQADRESKTVLIAGIGIGYKNMARAST